MVAAQERFGVIARVGTAQAGFDEMVIFCAITDILLHKSEPIDLKNTTQLQILAESISQWLVLEETDESQFLVHADTTEDHLIELLRAVRDCHNKYNVLLQVPELVLEDLGGMNGARKLVVKRTNNS